MLQTCIFQGPGLHGAATHMFYGERPWSKVIFPVLLEGLEPECPLHCLVIDAMGILICCINFVSEIICLQSKYINYSNAFSLKQNGNSIIEPNFIFLVLDSSTNFHSVNVLH